MTSSSNQTVRKIADVCPSWECNRLTFETRSGWPLFNPSIFLVRNEIWGIVRTANYRLTPQGMYPIIDDPSIPATGDIRTRNYLFRLSDQLDLIESPSLISLAPGVGEPSWHDHLEDLRPFTLNDEMYAVASLYEYEKDTVSMRLVKLNDRAEIICGFMLPSPFKRNKEKNWMPIVKDNELRLVYSSSPTVIVGTNFDDNVLSVYSSGGGLKELYGWSGSSQGCAVGEWTLCVVHTRAETSEGTSYIHRFVMFDAKLRVCALSEPFVFHGYGIEFCAGLVCNENQLVLSYGVNDALAMIGSMSLYDALNSITWRKPA